MIRIWNGDDTDRHPEIRRRVLELVEEYESYLGMKDTWEIYVWFPEGCDDLDTPDRFAECAASGPDSVALLTFHVDLLSEEYDLEGSVRHELLHALVVDLADTARHFAGEKHAKIVCDREEALVRALERAPLWGRLTGRLLRPARPALPASSPDPSEEETPPNTPATPHGAPCDTRPPVRIATGPPHPAGRARCSRRERRNRRR